MYAHYFESKTGEKRLFITDSPRVTLSAKSIPVAGKKEARAKAAELNAKPWNF